MLLAATIGTAETESAPQHADGEDGRAKRNFRRERSIEVDIAWHEHIYEMSGNPFFISFASLFHSVYQTYFTSITYNDVVKLDLHQAIVDAIDDNDGNRAFCLSGIADSTPATDNR
ncbi:FCD domain-containing protein [Shigella flexneri]